MCCGEGVVLRLEGNQESWTLGQVGLIEHGMEYWDYGIEE